ncbi:MAG: prepilin-type N-terminal cleavage/methylation domain-containing protein [Actinomycetota bacterium]
MAAPGVRDERGMTLPELLVGMTLLVAVMSIVFTVLASVQEGYEDQSKRSINNDQMRLAIEQIDKEIRSANAFTVTTSAWVADTTQPVEGTNLVVYTQTSADTREGGFSCVQWRVQGGELQSRRWPLNWESDADELITGWREVASSVIVDPVTYANGTYFSIPSNVGYGDRLLRTQVVVNSSSDLNETSNLKQTRDIAGRNVQFLSSDDSNVCMDNLPPA